MSSAFNLFTNGYWQVADVRTYETGRKCGKYTDKPIIDISQELHFNEQTSFT